MMDKNERSYLWQLIERKAATGDKDALNAMGAMCVDEAMRLGDSSYLERAEDYYRRSAAAGNSHAARYLDEVWGRVKREHKHRLKYWHLYSA
jgi:aromatic ring hydroxylase